MHEQKTINNPTKATEILCFDKNEFMKINFSVDEFLHKNRNAPSLEQLRDNLGLYLKDLRSSMIDLINEDYADFVNLSANLVGLDESIKTIQNPLEHFRDEINDIKTVIEDNEKEIETLLKEKKEIRNLKQNLQSLKKVNHALKKLEDLLNNQLSTNLCSTDLERAALELIQLKFNEKFCLDYLTDEQRLQVSNLNNGVLNKLRKFFNDTLKTSSSTNTEELERCLRIYITLDACHIAETVFREDVVAPYMSPIISEHSLQNSPQGLAGIYSKILNFISLNMTDLLRLTFYTDKLRGFNFLVHSFWTDVEMRLETHLTSIFAPGDSEVFYSKYKCTGEFLSKVEELLINEQAVTEFRQFKRTKNFQSRWNLPVYFQICFQEIAGQFEGTLEPILTNNSFNRSDNQRHFQISTFNNAQKAIDRCWVEGVYLPEIFPKFYKLTVQIVLRTVKWITDVINLTKSSGNNDLPVKMNKISFLSALHTDIQKFMCILGEMHSTILKHLPKEKDSELVKDIVAKSIGNLEDLFTNHLRTIQEVFVSFLIVEAGADNLRQVSDLPRLYRKTNRDVPTRCSTYVDQMVRPLKAFADHQDKELGQDIVEDVLAKVSSKITTDYFAAVNDVLTSVQKTEESLRRLRNLKAGSNAMTTSATAPNTVSDDDKIRLQLRVDVVTWTSELGKMNFMPSQIDKLLELNNLVEDSIKVKE